MVLDTIVRTLTVLLASWSAAHPQVPVTLTNDMQYDAGLATHGGVTAWWGAGREPKRPHLMVRTRDGAVHALAPELSEFAEAVDVGRGPDGGVWITYARCGRSAASCRAYAYDMKTRREHALGLGQAVAVAVDGARVAWFREPRHAGPSQLLVGSLGAHRGAARQVPLAKIEGEPVAAPTGLDLAGGHLAYTAFQGGDDVRTLLLRAGTPARMIDVAAASFGEECTFAVASPAVTRDAVTWLSSTLGSHATCHPRFDQLVRRRFSDGALSHAAVRAPAAKEAVVAGGRVVVLAPRRSDGDQGDRDACVPDALLNDEGAGFAGCELRVLAPPRWVEGGGGAWVIAAHG